MWVIVIYNSMMWVQKFHGKFNGMEGQMKAKFFMEIYHKEFKRYMQNFNWVFQKMDAKFVTNLYRVAC